MPDYDLAIVGSGPGGYVAAIRAAQLGMKTALVERDKLGGICLNWGCIPTKALLRNAELASLLRNNAQEFGISFDNLRIDYLPAMKRSRNVANRLSKGVEFLMKKNAVSVIQGEASLADKNTLRIAPSGETLSAQRFILATGSRPASLPGLEFDGQRIISSDHAVVLESNPAKVVIIGAGAVGVEFAYLFQAYGSEVHVIEMLPHILPQEDEEISILLEKALIKQGIAISTNTRVEKVEKGKAGVRVTASSPNGPVQIEAEVLLMAIGRRGNIENLGLEAMGVVTDRGYVKVDGRLQTNVEGIYAIGDVTGPPLLAHRASHQGIVAVEGMAGMEVEPIDEASIPACTYCQPQVASIGLTEAAAREKGYEVKVGRFPFRANGKALALGDSEGLIKLVVDARYGEILGAHMIGPEVTELIHEIGIAKKLEATALSVGRAIHAHPTLSEALMEAALDAEGRVIHT